MPALMRPVDIGTSVALRVMEGVRVVVGVRVIVEVRVALAVRVGVRVFVGVFCTVYVAVGAPAIVLVAVPPAGGAVGILVGKLFL